MARAGTATGYGGEKLMAPLVGGIILIVLALVVPWPAEIAWLGTLLLVLGVLAALYGVYLLFVAGRGRGRGLP
jgi:hypothetical protein